MDLTIYSGNQSEFEDELSPLYEIAAILKAAEPAVKPVYMITNVLLGNKRLDCLLLTEKGPIIIDCMACQGKISGCETGTWTVETPSGQIVEMNTNPYEQSKKQRYAFLRKWRGIVDKHFMKQIPEKQILHFCNWVYFGPGSVHHDDRFDYSKVTWFSIVTRENLLSSIESLNRQYRISKTGYDKILHEIGLNPGTPGEMKPRTDGGEEPGIMRTVETPSGSVPLMIQKGDIQIVFPPRMKSRTPEFLNTFHEAVLNFENHQYDRALQLIEFALKKDRYDHEAQDLKFDILCLLGKKDEAEEYLLKAVKGL